MVVAVKQNVSEEKLNSLVSFLKEQDINVHIVRGQYQTVLGLIGDTSKIDIDTISGLDIVESVMRISEPYKSANRKFHPDDTVITIPSAMGAVEVGARLHDNRRSLLDRVGGADHRGRRSGQEVGREYTARRSVSSRAPRPYAFQGLRGEGLKLLLEAKKATGLPIITEIMDRRHLDLFGDVDIIQVGARNMQNFELLKEPRTLEEADSLKARSREHLAGAFDERRIYHVGR